MRRHKRGRETEQRSQEAVTTDKETLSGNLMGEGIKPPHPPDRILQTKTWKLKSGTACTLVHGGQQSKPEVFPPVLGTC